MLNPISLAFKKAKKEKRPALLTYTVAGDNTKKKSLEILKSISEHADILEIGFPHNAPTADGPQIQNSSYRALKNGIKLKDVFQIVKNYKKNKNSKPCILMGYYQMVYRYGPLQMPAFSNPDDREGENQWAICPLPPTLSPAPGNAHGRNKKNSS